MPTGKDNRRIEQMYRICLQVTASNVEQHFAIQDIWEKYNKRELPVLVCAASMMDVAASVCTEVEI